MKDILDLIDNNISLVNIDVNYNISFYEDMINKINDNKEYFKSYILDLSEDNINELVSLLDKDKQKSFIASILYLKKLLEINQEENISIPLSENQEEILLDLYNLMKKIVLDYGEDNKKKIKEIEYQDKYDLIKNKILNNEVLNINDYNLLEKIVYTYVNNNPDNIFNMVMTNINDYNYIFDRLLKNNIPYILNLNTKLTNQDREIYYNAKRIIYTLPEFDMEIINYLHENKVTFEFSITGLKESNVFSELENYDIYNLYKENNLITFVSRDMTILNTDILNEYCLIFNKLPFTVHDIIKINLNNLENCNIPIEEKNDIINMYRDKSNLIL